MVLMFVLVLAQPAPSWTRLYADRVVTVEIDRQRVKHPTSTTADAWTQITYTTPDTLVDGQRYTRYVQHAIYDCTRHRYLIAQLVLFDASGRIIKVSAEPPATAQWVNEPKGSVADTQAVAACASGSGA